MSSSGLPRPVGKKGKSQAKSGSEGWECLTTETRSLILMHIHSFSKHALGTVLGDRNIEMNKAARFLLLTVSFSRVGRHIMSK